MQFEKSITLATFSPLWWESILWIGGGIFLLIQVPKYLKNIQIKRLQYSESVQLQLNSNKIDTLTLHSIFKGADINFGKSNTKSIPCKTYRVVGKVYEMDVENCDRIATIKTLIIR